MKIFEKQKDTSRREENDILFRPEECSGKDSDSVWTLEEKTGFWGRAANLRRALFFARSQKWHMVLILFLTLVIAALNAVEPLIMKYIFDGLGEKKALSFVFTGVAMFFGLGALREGTGMLSNWLTWRSRLRIQHHLLDLTVDRIHRLPHDVHREEGVGAIMTRLDRSIQGLTQAITEICLGILPGFVYLGIAATIMVRMNLWLALIVVCFGPLPMIIANWAGPRQTQREEKLLDRWANIYGRFNEVLSGIITVRSFVQEDAEKRRFLKDVFKANRLVLKGVGFDSTISSAQTLVQLLTRISCIGLGGYLVVRGEITVGTLLAFLGYVGGFFGPVQGLAGIYKNMSIACVSADQIYSILNTQEHIGDAPNAVSPDPVHGNVSFEDVHFAYEVNDRAVLKGISFEARPGQMIAIVGPSGSGKSTIIALLQRFYDPTRGRILLDGMDLRDIKQKELRRNIGVVMQDAMLFNESVRASISYGKPNATQAEVEAAARAANAHDFIMRFPEGYNTAVGERGCRFSVGERQRIAIARAILINPRILILDEATSALDAETEFLVQEAVGRLIQGRTAFVIAHRLSTVVKADRILVLKKGRIIEQGSHAELMALGGYYAYLVERQTCGLLRPEASPGPLEALSLKIASGVNRVRG